MAEVTYMTREGYNKLKAELEHMRAKERPAAAAAIAEARDKGDLSEMPNTMRPRRLRPCWRCA